MHEQTAVVPLAPGDGAATNLTIHLHIHAGPAVAPVNGQGVRIPVTSPAPTVSRPVTKRQLSPPKPEPIGHAAGNTTTPATTEAAAGEEHTTEGLQLRTRGQA